MKGQKLTVPEETKEVSGGHAVDEDLVTTER